MPDILTRISRRDREPLNVLVQVTGEKRKDEQVKVDTARTLWVPAVNTVGRFSEWTFYRVTDPWNTENDLRAHIPSLAGGA